MADFISLKTIDGEEFSLDLDLVSSVTGLEDIIEIMLMSGRKLEVEKTPEFMEALFHRSVSLEEAKAILDRRNAH